jgi:hypothetical protein
MDANVGVELAMASDATRALVGGGVLILAAVAAGFVLHWLRGRTRSGQGTLEAPAGFTMERLEELRSRGAVTPEEFKALRSILLGQGPIARENAQGSSSGPIRRDDGKKEAADDSARDEGV